MVHSYGMYGGAYICQMEVTFRWYWQANAWSWFMHHVLGRSCNTYKKDSK